MATRCKYNVVQHATQRQTWAVWKPSRIMGIVRRENAGFFLANDIDTDRKVPSLISSFGRKTYTLLKTSFLRPKLRTRVFMTPWQHYAITKLSKTLIIAERFRFHKRDQRPGKSMLSYTHCQFDASLNDTMRDRLVVDLHNDTIQKRLLSETDLGFEKFYMI